MNNQSRFIGDVSGKTGANVRKICVIAMWVSRPERTLQRSPGLLHPIQNMGFAMTAKIIAPYPDTCEGN